MGGTISFLEGETPRPIILVSGNGSRRVSKTIEGSSWHEVGS